MHNHFFAFLLATLFSLRILPLFVFREDEPPSFRTAAGFRTLCLFLPLGETPCSASDMRAFFLATLRARRSASAALAFLRSSLDMWINFSPKEGSPLGTTGVDKLTGFCGGPEAAVFKETEPL